MDREQFIRRQLDKQSLGLEIGPSHAPIAPKAAGYNVRIMDHLSKPALVSKYTGHGVDLSRIEEVDYVSKGESFHDLMGETTRFDWIIASHVIEHTPDFIGFLNNCASVLGPGGRLILAVPDKRRCFDEFRSLTDIGKIVDAHLERRTLHSAGSVVDYYLNVVRRDGGIVWDASPVGRYETIHTMENALSGIEVTTKHRQYLDIHAWCFTPLSFRLMIRDLNELGFIKLREIEFLENGSFEFLCALGLEGSLIPGPRVELLKAIRASA